MFCSVQRGFVYFLGRPFKDHGSISKVAEEHVTISLCCCFRETRILYAPSCGPCFRPLSLPSYFFFGLYSVCSLTLQSTRCMATDDVLCLASLVDLWPPREG